MPRSPSSIAEILAPGGELFVQTDVWDIALDALSAFDGDERFANVAGEWTFWKRGQSVRRAVVARAERRGDRPADLADPVPHAA